MIGPVGDGSSNAGHREEINSVCEVHVCGVESKCDWKIVLGLYRILAGDEVDDLIILIRRCFTTFIYLLENIRMHAL